MELNREGVADLKGLGFTLLAVLYWWLSLRQDGIKMGWKMKEIETG